MNKPRFLTAQNLKLLFFGGKGGVGKTTCAAATGLHWAQQAPQHSFLLVSTDPAHSLADRLTIAQRPSNLQLLELDAQALLAEFKTHYSEPLRQIAARGTFLEDADIQSLIELSLPGLDEIIALLHLSTWVKEQRYQTIIVDTAPSGHTLRLLEMPQLLKKWLRALDTLLAKHRYMRRVLTGKTTHDALDQFLLHWVDKVQQLESLLHQPDNCQFSVVLLAEPLSYQETQTLLTALAQAHIPVNDIIFNQCSADNHPYFGQQQYICQQFVHQYAQRYTVWQQPVITDIATQLEHFWHQCSLNTQRLTDITVAAPAITVQYPALLPQESIKLHFFVGKGGVGKTTLACATALHLANHWQDKKILLFSTDPAHSLAACLEIKLGPSSTVIQNNLAAVELQPEKRFQQLKQKYQLEIEQCFDALSPNLTLPFEREALQALLELSPSGIDELMALTQLTDYLDYDLIIIDSAPSGHFIRLMELPELINQWLSVIFTILLKYKQMIYLPTLNTQLVHLSKNIKKLQKLLSQLTTTQISVVSLLAQLAFAETQDLAVACRRLNLPISRLFLNRLTAASKTHYWQTQYRQIFPDLPQTLIYAGHPPSGIECLSRLGQQLYRESTDA